MSVHAFQKWLVEPVDNLSRRMSLHTYRWVLWILFFLGSIQTLSAQCQLVCRGADPNNPIRVGIQSNCIVTVVDSLIQQSPRDCQGRKTIIIGDRFGNLVAQGVQPLTFAARKYIGQTLTVTILDQTTGLFCTGYIQPLDLIAPQISCTNLTLACSADTSAQVVGRPVVTDNCSPNIRARFSDQVTAGRCGSDTASVIFRTWTARDSVGNVGSCTQVIVLRRITAQDIKFPRDTTLSCSQPNTRPRLTGYPTFSGRTIVNNGFCNYNVAFQEDSIFTCGGTSWILTRRWTLRDGCTGTIYNQTQTITVKDLTPPVIICPAPFKAYTTPGQCSATVYLPKPTITDNCDPNPVFLIEASFGGTGLGPHFYVPKGTHVIKYTALDRCNNSTICFATLIVEDNQVPTAVCSNRKTVSLPDNGIAYVMAKSFDEGSKDNCNNILYFKARRVVPGRCNGINGDDAKLVAGYQEWFDDWVGFCCNDRDSGLVQVTLRVYDIDPGDGPVDPAREQSGGDLYGHYNDCTTAVSIQDQLPPRLVCPDNKTIKCSDDFSNLAKFGTPIVLENCSYRIDSTSSMVEKGCGRALITRNWTATDLGGLQSTCTQTIELVNDNELVESMITWPKDYVSTLGCGAKIEPADLPTVYREPVIRQATCGATAISREDKLFNAGYPSCYKILRTWTIIDWCNYNPNVSTTKGKFTYTQIIKVEDQEPPKLIAPKDITVAVSNNCTSATVNIPLPTVTDCSNSVALTNDSRFAPQRLGDASGEYPLGTTIVTYRAVDPCGNYSTVKVRVTVIDQKAPEMVCINKLSTNLTMKDGVSGAWVGAKAFDAGTLDRCTPASEIKFTIRRSGGLTPISPPTDEILSFTCDDIGLVAIELWGTDSNGNSAFCRTFVDIQDNNSICPASNITGQIAGVIKTSLGDNLEAVKMSLQGGTTNQKMTDIKGGFTFKDIQLKKDYRLVPEKNDDILNGVSTIDVILIQKHILGTGVLTSPYQLIAADVDKSGAITTLDLIKLRKVVLGYDTEFPNGNTSWRFIDASYQFPDGQDPLKVPFPESKDLKNLTNKNLQIDFVGVKVGDVNKSARANSLGGNENRSTNGEITVDADNYTFQQGEEFSVTFQSGDIEKLQGYQFTLDFNPKLLQLLDFQAGELPNLNTQNFGVAKMEKGLFSTSWNSQGATVSKGSLKLFTLKFKALRSSDLATALSLAEAPTPSEAYNKAGEQLSVLLQLHDSNGGKGTPKGSFALYQNYPNPFSERTQIGFTLPTAMPATISVFDLSGRLVYRNQGNFEKGYNEVEINRDMLNANGILYYQLETDTFTETKRMVLAAAIR